MPVCQKSNTIKAICQLDKGEAPLLMYAETLLLHHTFIGLADGFCCTKILADCYHTLSNIFKYKISKLQVVRNKFIFCLIFSYSKGWQTAYVVHNDWQTVKISSYMIQTKCIQSFIKGEISQILQNFASFAKFLSLVVVQARRQTGTNNVCV